MPAGAAHRAENVKSGPGAIRLSPTLFLPSRTVAVHSDPIRELPYQEGWEELRRETKSDWATKWGRVVDNRSVKPSTRGLVAMSAGIAISAATVVTILIIHSSKNPVNTATVLAGDAAVLALAATLLTVIINWWRKSSQESDREGTSSRISAAADRLAEEMIDEWQREARRRRIVTPAPAAVRWRWLTSGMPLEDASVVPASGSGPPAIPDSGGRSEVLGSGVVTRLHNELYAKLPHGRLIVIGEPGAGKTAAMILLLLAALEYRASRADEERERVPVPVWLTMGNWDPETTSLRGWAAERINLDHPALRARQYGENVADVLLRSGEVALFMDGLDEIPEKMRPQALRRINDEATRIRIVLTSRIKEYQESVSDFTPDNTAVIELQPVRPAEIERYLLRGQPERHKQQWQQVAEYIKDNPGSSAALVLDNPPYLSLARDSYARKDPASLIDPAAFSSAAELREHLVEQILVSAYPDERERSSAEWWLAWIAFHMKDGRDLSWWEIPGWIQRRHLILAGTINIALAIWLISIALANSISDAYGGGLVSLSYLLPQDLFGLLYAIPIGIVCSIWYARPGRPRTLRPSGRGLAALLVIPVIIILAFVSTFIAPSFSMTGLLEEPILGILTIVPAVIAAIAFVRLLGTPVLENPAATAGDSYYADLRMSNLTRIVIAVAIGLASNVAFQEFDQIVYLIINTASSGATAFFAAAPISGQSPKVQLAERILARRYRNRIHFTRFLEAASSVQVLRQAGIVYQFRHAVLPDHLAATWTTLATRTPSKRGRAVMRSVRHPATVDKTPPTLRNSPRQVRRKARRRRPCVERLEPGTRAFSPVPHVSTQVGGNPQFGVPCGHGSERALLRVKSAP